MAAITLAPWQWAVIVAAYVAFFVAPAAWMYRRARRDAEEHPFVWTGLVLVGSVLGIVEYFEHRAILKARARRGDEAPDYGAATRRPPKEP